MNGDAADAALGPSGGAPRVVPGPAQARNTRRALAGARAHLQRSALKLLGYLVAAYLVLKLIPGLREALSSLEHVRWQWVVGALALETLSETGFVVSWSAIVDPENLLSRDGRDQRMDMRAAWAQLGGGILVPGGSLGGVGVGAWILHHFGMRAELIAERQFNLSFLNTAVDGLAVVIVGIGLATGIFAGEARLTLTLLPAALAAIGIVAALLLARPATRIAERMRPRHPKLAVSIATLARSVEDTKHLLVHRDGLKSVSVKSVCGAVAYLGFDLLVLWSAFIAIHAHPAPTFAVVVMAYIIGALGGSIPLPANIGTIGGMVAMFILYGVGHSEALAAVLIYQAIGLLVPLTGGAIAYLFLRSKFGPIQNGLADVPDAVGKR